MQWLGAALAFAITMLALSTVVTMTVETIHRIIGLREKGLRLMLGHFYDAAIAPHVDLAVGAATSARDQFLDLMTTNRAPAGDVALPARDDANDRSFLSWIWGGRRLGSLSLDDFMARLGDSPFGDAVAEVQTSVGTTAIDVVLRDMAHKFESFGRDASEYFQARARLVSVLVAFVIGWQCYVNPLLLARTFLRDPAVTAKVIEAGPKFIAESKQAEKSLAETSAAADAGVDPAAVQKSLQEGRRQAAEIFALGVPIGWTDARLQEAGFKITRVWLVCPSDWSRALPTIAWLVLGGLLIGLGSPFWRDAVLSLTAFRDRTQKAAAEVAALGRDPLALAAERFLTASQARAATRVAAAELDTDVPVG